MRQNSRLARALVFPLLYGLAAADTCLSQGELAGVVFGSVFGTLVICACIGAALYCFLWRQPKSKIANAKTNHLPPTATKTTERGCDPENVPHSDKFTLIDSYKLRRKSDFAQQKSFSSEDVNEVEAVAAVDLSSKSLQGLGFSVRGSMGEGIFIREVIEDGPADTSKNVFPGDRIRGLWISFDEMVFSDAVTILSYASPYKVKLELERKVAETPTLEIDTQAPSTFLHHPLFRSNSLRQRVQFNPTSCSPPIRVESESTTQKFALPSPRKEEKPELQREKSYESITTPRDPTPEPEPEPQQIDEEKDVSSKQHSKMSSSDYSSTSDVSSMSKEAVPQPPLELSVSPTPPVAEICAPVPIPKTAKSLLAPDDAENVSEEAAAIRAAEPNRTVTGRICVFFQPPPQAKAPDFTEARVSRIPRRDSEKSIIIERKLPRVPSGSFNRSNTMEQDATIWSRLYQEKKGQLKKTREKEGRAKSEDAIYGTLRGDHRRRLTQNEEQLERQIAELRQLGVL
ncbi:unnamed protein product, partial [Mesorhabditis spiculigera]